jgi:hypothetical protein
MHETVPTKTRELLARLKAANARCALFFCAFVGMCHYQTTFPLEVFSFFAPRSWWSCFLLSDCKLESGSESG